MAICVVSCAGSQASTSESAQGGEAATGSDVAKHSSGHHASPASASASESSSRKKEPSSAGQTASTQHPDEGQTADAKPSVFKQGNDEIDLDLTQRIRKQLVADDALSFSAKNVKIITQDGVVTLLGSVKNEAEAKEVRNKAVAEAGQGRVQDHLEISP